MKRVFALLALFPLFAHAQVTTDLPLRLNTEIRVDNDLFIGTNTAPETREVFLRSDIFRPHTRPDLAHIYISCVVAAHIPTRSSLIFSAGRYRVAQIGKNNVVILQRTDASSRTNPGNAVEIRLYCSSSDGYTRGTIQVTGEILRRTFGFPVVAFGDDVIRTGL